MRYNDMGCVYYRGCVNASGYLRIVGSWFGSILTSRFVFVCGVAWRRGIFCASRVTTVGLGRACARVCAYVRVRVRVNEYDIVYLHSRTEFYSARLTTSKTISGCTSFLVFAVIAIRSGKP